MNKILIHTAFALAFGTVALASHAATLVNGNVLTITTGNYAYDSDGNPVDVSSGSWFGCDCNANNAISGTEKSSMAQGTTGIVIGVATLPGASHSGDPLPGDTNAIDAPYSFLGNTGSHYTTVGVTGSTGSGLDMSGWTYTWNGIPAINMGSGAWGAGYSNGVGNFVWDGVYGHGYTLDYHARAAHGDPSGFGDVGFAWHFEGVVAVPEASTYGMMLAGLGLVGFAARRRKRRVFSRIAANLAATRWPWTYNHERPNMASDGTRDMETETCDLAPPL
jgi:hypothetical protein